MVVFDKTGTLTTRPPELLDADAFPTMRCRGGRGSPPRSKHPYARAHRRARREQRLSRVARRIGVEEIPGAASSAAGPMARSGSARADWCGVAERRARAARSGIAAIGMAPRSLPLRRRAADATPPRSSPR